VIATLRASLASAEWLAALAALPGYQPLRSGEVLSLTEVLPWWRYRNGKARP
jgi:putative molybdopterin biosynthesis protein